MTTELIAVYDLIPQSLPEKVLCTFAGQMVIATVRVMIPVRICPQMFVGNAEYVVLFMRLFYYWVKIALTVCRVRAEIFLLKVLKTHLTYCSRKNLSQGNFMSKLG